MQDISQDTFLGRMREREKVMAGLEEEIAELSEKGLDTLYDEFRITDFNSRLEIGKKGLEHIFQRTTVKYALLLEAIRGIDTERRMELFGSIAEKYCQAVESEDYHRIISLKRELESYREHFLTNESDFKDFEPTYKSCKKLVGILGVLNLVRDVCRVNLN